MTGVQTCALPIYFFRVSAVTSAGTGAGAVVSAVPTGPPAAPTGLGIVANAGQAIVSWIPPNYIGIIATFNVEYRVVGTTNLTSISVNGTTTSANISGLVNGTAYEFRVRANGAVAGNWTSFVQKTPYSAPSGIGSFSATPGAGEVALKWLTPSSNDLGGMATPNYVVQYSSDGGNTWTEIGRAHV